MPTRSASKRQKTTDTNNNMAHAWSDLPNALSQALPSANQAAQSDSQMKAFLNSDAITQPSTFGIKAAGSDNAIVITVSRQKVNIGSGITKDCSFVLSALPEQWQEFMKQTPVMPYQSFWGKLHSPEAFGSLC